MRKHSFPVALALAFAFAVNAKAQTVETVPRPVVQIDHSAALTTANTAQYLMSGNGARTGFRIENNSPTDICWYSWNGIAVAGAAGSFILKPQTPVEASSYVPTNQLSVVCGVAATVVALYETQ